MSAFDPALLQRIKPLFQIRVLGLRSDEDGNVRVGILPEHQKILIRHLGFGGVALHRVGAAELKARQRPSHIVLHNARMIDQFLIFDRGGCTVVRRKIRLAPYIGRIEAVNVYCPCS